ncbi:hypothetical protein ABAC460_20585 [Asticcacaulis sp. AC460]|uniref:hypothetical protein n=1 Tax=Asticcacaulis sp. AC460 TaxID=1282360 RepID=UPI0003C3BA60|nr:hypothetical protein [Asticcacaulis sp. AC460]ESQ87171.1 hypothetical protein ABAC460_20585 [Asticcacaulis sp. AC460]
MKLIITALTTAALLALPALAQAADGYVTCQAYSPDKNKVLYTQAFAADKADADALYDKFVKFLADNSYTTSMYSSEPSPVEGICNWEASESAANKKTAGFKANYEAKGASTLGVSGFPE